MTTINLSEFVFRFVLIMLATYRLTDDIALMQGPGEIFVKFRRWVKKKYPDQRWVQDGIYCPICISFWVGFVFVFLFMPVSIPDKFLVWMAVISLPTLFTRKLYGWNKPTE